MESIETHNDGLTMTYRILLKRKDYVCPYCQGKLYAHGYKDRFIRHPTLSEYRSVIIFHSRRYRCTMCGRTVLEENPFGFEGFRSSYAQLRKILLLLKNLNYTVQMIADELYISPTMVNRYLDSYITVPLKPPLPECMGIDELHSKVLSHRNSAYICVITDNEKRTLSNILGSRSKNYLKNHFYSYPEEERKKVRYVTIDMWKPYLDISQKLFPEAKVAVDPFHVVKHLCDDFTEIRVRIMKDCIYGSNAYYLLKNWNWLLETGNVDLDNEPQYNSRFRMKLNRRQLLEMVLSVSDELKTAYFLKEEYRAFNKQMSYEEARDSYDALIRDFEREDIKEYREFVSILKNWKIQILHSFLRPYEERKLSNSFCENINGKMRTYIDISRGITNFTRFRKRTMYALNDKIFYSLTEVLTSDKKEGRKRGKYKKGANE